VPSSFDWNGDAFEKEVRRNVADKLDTIGEQLVLVLKNRLSVVGLDVNGNTVHSARGQSPFLQTGDLQEAVTHETNSDDLYVDIGVPGEPGPVAPGAKPKPADYAMALEEGTDNMAPRPWLKSILDTEKTLVQKILDS
jgi:hypothetical protein